MTSLRRSRLRAVAVLVTAMAATASAADGPADRAVVVRVAAAADLRFALDALTKEAAAGATPLAVKATHASSGVLFAQLQQGAPFDVFLSADAEYPQKLHDAGVCAAPFAYATGHLVLWSRTIDVATLGPQAFARAGKVAIANPRTAPYGRAAEATLRSLGVYDDVKAKLVLGDNVAHTAQLVDTGAADVGLVAASLAVAPAMQGGSSWAVPGNAHAPLVQAGCVVVSGDPRAGEALRTLLVGARGQAVLARFGFDPPPQPPSPPPPSSPAAPR